MAQLRAVATLGAAGWVRVTTRPWLVLAASCPNEAGPVAYCCDRGTVDTASLPTAWGLDIHTMGADGLEWFHG